MRVYFLTLRADNLPETGKRQHENKGTCAPTRRDGFNGRTTRKEKNLLPSFPPKEMPALFPVQRNIETRLKPLEQARYCMRRRPCQGTINLYGRLRICILCNVGLVRPRARRIQGMAAARGMPDRPARKLSTRTRTGSENSWPPAMPPHQRVGSTPIRAKTGSHKGKKKFSIPGARSSTPIIICGTAAASAT